jgi:cytochrome c biogenesis protein CcmG, thiol:disulfide interchange protein DsbE
MATSTKNQSPKTGTSRSIPVVGIIVAVIAVIVVVAVVFAGNTEPGNEFGEPQVTGQLSFMPPDTAVDVTANGETAPTVIGQDFDGNEVRIENDGRAKAIALLAHWCPHCQDEVPVVQAWIDSGGGVDGVDLYSVATSMDSTRDNYPPSEWFDREGWTAPVIRDDSSNSVHAAYGSGGFPFWVFVNSDGTVAARVAGFTSIENLQLIMQDLT